MIRALIEQTFDSTKKYLVLFGLSTDNKPVSGLITGSEFHEVDTGVKYEFDEVNSQWHEVGITEQEIKDEIDAWLDDNPEATTTVEDGSITNAKLASSFVTPGTAAAYSSSATYAVGDYCFHNGSLYRCITPITTAEAWTAGHWTAVVLGDDVSDLKSAIPYKADNKYGGTETSSFVTLTNKKGWNATNGNFNAVSNRAASAQTEKTPDMSKITCASGYYMTLMANDLGAGNAMQTIGSAWISSVDLSEVNYKYLFVVIKKSDNTDFADGTTSDVISIYKYTETIPYLTGEDVASLETDIEQLQDAIIETNSVNLVGKKDEVGTSAMANTRRWFLPYTIPANSKIENIQYHTASAISGTITFEIWKKNGNTLTLDKSVSHTPTASSVNTVAIDYTSTTDIMFGWRISDGSNIRQIASTVFNLWATTDMSSSSLSVSDLDKISFTTYTPCITVPYTHTAPKDYLMLSGTIVTVGEGMDYEQIQDAIEAITDDSASKPYTILVMPKGTPYERFSTLRSFDQTYPWNSINPRYISIIGMDRKHCIVRSDSGNYKLPCGEPMLNGMIKNLTFIMTNDDQDENATQGGYCLHIDCRTNNDVGYNMVIEDCDFEDASGPCLGIGMHKNCTLTIRRCNFKTTLSENYSPHEGYTNLYNYGVIFCHSSTRADATNQRINIEDCFGVCAEGNKSLWLSIAGDYSPATASFYYRLLRNVFWNETQNAPAYSISGTLTAEPMNFGNNIPT